MEKQPRELGKGPAIPKRSYSQQDSAEMVSDKRV